MASSSGMQVSVTRFMWRSSRACSSGGREVAVVGHAFVEIVGYEVEDIFLQVGPRAADNLHFILANKLGQLNPHFGGAHGPGQGYHHFAAFGEVLVVAIGRVDEGSGVEVAVVVLEEIGNVHFFKLLAISC